MTAITHRDLLDRPLAPDWKAALAPGLPVLGGLFLFYGETLWSMVLTWARSETFAHGFLVLPIVLWLVWRARRQVAGVDPAPSTPALGLLALAGIVWFFGHLAQANALAQGGFIGMVAAAVPALFGWRVARVLAFPLAFLAFAVPLGEFLVPQLMEWTARFTVLGLELSGVPVYREGLDFVIPSGKWSVVEACSGIRYLIASLMVGTLFAYLNFRSPARRAAFLAVSLGVPIVANWVRAYGIVMIGHYSGNRLATGIDHLIYGWVFFGVVVAVLFLIGSRWADKPAGAGESGPAAPHGPRAARNLDWRAAGLAALVAVLPLAAAKAMEGLDRPAAPVLSRDAAPFAVGGWRPAADPESSGKPVFPEAADEWHQTFEKDGRRVGLHIGYYRGPGHRLSAPVLGGEGPARQWYWAAGAPAPDPARARLLGAWSRLKGQGGDGAAIVVTAAPGDEEAVEDFARSASPALNQILNDTRNRR